MSVIVAFAKHGKFLERLREAANCDVISIWPGVSDRALKGMLEELDDIDMAFIADEVDLGRAFEVGHVFSKIFPDVPVVLSTEMSDVYAGPARRAGITETVEAELSEIDLQRLVGRYVGAPATSVAPVEAPSVPSLSPDQHRVIVVLSPKGGVGKTTISVNLAVAISESYPMQTVLLDYEDQFGDAASALNISARHTAEDAFDPHGGVRDSLVVQGLLSTFKDRLLLLAASDSPAAMEKVSGQDATELVSRLSSQYPFVVIDTAAGISDLTLSALEVATDVLFVTTMDISSIRALRRSIDLLGRIHLLPSRCLLVVNQADPEAGLSPEAISKALDLPVSAVIERSSEVVLSMNTGKPMSASKSPSQFKDAVAGLAVEFQTEHVPSAADDGSAKFWRFGRK